MLSPYSQLCADTVDNLNLYFAQVFQLKSHYQYEGITEGDRYGIISFRSFEPDREHSEASSFVRHGFQFMVLKLEILLSLGGSDRISSESLGIEAMMDLHHGIPTLKQFLDDTLIHDLKTEDRFNCVKRQATKPPHNWIVDITCEATAKVALFINASGQHVLKMQ